jgi:hypothetical protein
MSNGTSLHVGVNQVDPKHYSGWSGPLTACEADAEDMQRIAKAKGYDSQILLTDKATRSAVIAGIENAANRLAPGDIFLLSYSGHGGQVPDVSGDEMDLEDETWCLYDGELIDDELAELWARFAKGVRILVLSDSCHSGTAIKMREYDELAATGLVQRAASRVEGDKPPVFRVMPEEVALRTYRANREFYKEIAHRLLKSHSPIMATVRLISACMDNQLSLDGTFNGLFTGTLLRVWNDGAFAGNYRAFHSEILNRMPSTQSPNHFVIGEPNPAFDGQAPFEIYS